MKIRPMLAVTLAVLPALAFAHTHLTRSLPADRSRVSAPQRFELHFSGMTKLTALTLLQGTQVPIRLVPLPEKPASDFVVPAPKLAPGNYVVEWRAVGDDGHVMSGKFSFVVDPAATAAPDH